MENSEQLEPSTNYQATSDAKDPKIGMKKKDRRHQLRKLFVIGLISAATVVLTVIEIISTVTSYSTKMKLVTRIQGSIETAYVIHQLQEERSLTTLQFGFKQLNFHDHSLKLKDRRHETDKSILLLEKRDDTSLRAFTGGAFSLAEILKEFRSKIDNGQANVIEHLKTYTYWVSVLISTLANYTKSQNLGNIADLVYSYQMFVLSKEEAAMEHALGSYKFTKAENFSIVNTTWYNEKRVLSQNYLQTAFLFSTTVKTTFKVLMMNNKNIKLMEAIEKKRHMLAVSEIYQNSSEVEAHNWFQMMTKYNNLMLKLQEQLAILIEERVNKKLGQSRNQLGISAMLLCFMFFVLPSAIISFVKVQKRLHESTLLLFTKVELEQGKTDFLMQENARHAVGRFLHCLYFYYASARVLDIRQVEQKVAHMEPARRYFSIDAADL